MENRFPLFMGRRILKKESLWDVRDYAYAGWQLYYADYTDGLLKGCAIRTEDGTLVIGRGMMKFHEFIYLMQEEEKVDYQPHNGWQILKVEFSEDETNFEYKGYRARFFLDRDMELKENQMEMCRFYLREGSVLRDSYKNFSDMATEYDTVNLIHATVAGVGEKTLHPALLLQFGEELWNMREKDAADFGICSLIWNAQGRVERKVIAAYLCGKLVDDTAEKNDNNRIYGDMERIIDNKSFRRERRTPKRIIVE